MITLQLTPADVEKVRFAFSPLIELSASYKVLLRPDHQVDYQSWVEDTQRMFDRIEFPYMSAVILDHGYIADFLTPTPTKTILNFEDEIDRVRETPDEVIRKNVEYVISLAGMTPIRRLFLDHTREALECLIEELRFYWQQALEPHWTQMSTVLEGDVLYRARSLARYGIDAMFSDLSEEIDYRQGVLHVHKNHEGSALKEPRIFQLKGEGIQLVPAIFASCGGAWQVAPEWLPMLIYRTRGLGLWRQNAILDTNPYTESKHPLQLTLGTSRARLLQALIEPSHTNELAQRLSLTAGAVSQQLGRLGQAGLIESYRSGSKVYYRLSTRGERLLDVFTE
jgi:DNA-binding transcriptional ArsR family regulator